MRAVEVEFMRSGAGRVAANHAPIGDGRPMLGADSLESGVPQTAPAGPHRFAPTWTYPRPESDPRTEEVPLQLPLPLFAAALCSVAILPAQTGIVASNSDTATVAATAHPSKLSARPLDAIPSSTEALTETQKFRQSRIGGKHLRDKVKRLTKELEWHESLDKAQKAAQQAGKPILWVQMLGDLDGHT